MTRSIEIIISPTGQAKLETRGFVGDSCRETSRFLEQALGTRVDEQLTAEFHQKPTLEQSQQLRP
jgi:hypothetical protein